MKELLDDWSMVIIEEWESNGISYCIGHSEFDTEDYIAGTLDPVGTERYVIRFRYDSKPERDMVEKDCVEHISSKEDPAY